MPNQAVISAFRGLQRHIPPMHLYEMAKRDGMWNPTDIDLSQDIKDWWSFNAAEQDLLLRLTSIFQSGVETVIMNLIPLIEVIAYEGRLEEEMYLATLLLDEVKHTDFFCRIISEVVQSETELSQYYTPNFRNIIYEAFPEVLGRLHHDNSLTAQLHAAMTYHLVLEGVLAETGYHAYSVILNTRDLMPGVRRGIGFIEQDLARHTGYGTFLLSRLIVHDKGLWSILEENMNSLLAPAMSVIGEIFAAYDPMPFGLITNDYLNYALDQFTRRFSSIQEARGASLDEIYRMTSSNISEYQSAEHRA